MFKANITGSFEKVRILICKKDDEDIAMDCRLLTADDNYLICTRLTGEILVYRRSEIRDFCLWCLNES